MSHADALQEILTNAATPNASATALAVLQELAKVGDFTAARALAAALAISLGYDDAAVEIRRAEAPTDFLGDCSIPAILRIYVVGLSPRILLDERERCRAIAAEVGATDDFRRFQRLVRRDDLLQHEGLKAYVLTAFSMVHDLPGIDLFSPAGALSVVDHILKESQVATGAAVDSDFSVGRDKILAISLEGMLSILLHELGHHVFEWGTTNSDLSTDEKRKGVAATDKSAPTSAVIAELVAELPTLIAAAQKKAGERGPPPLRLANGLSFLLTIETLPAGSYVHMSLTDKGGPISRASAGDYAFLILKLIRANPEEAATAMSPRGVFHFGVRGNGPTQSDLKRLQKTVDPNPLLVDLRPRSVAWLDRLSAAGRLAIDGNQIRVDLGLAPGEPSYYPADRAAWNDIMMCQGMRAGPAGVQLSRDQFRQAVSAAIRAGDTEILRALVAAGGSAVTLNSEDIANAGSRLGVIDDRAGAKHYVGPTPDGILAVLKTLHGCGGDLNCAIDERGATLLIAAARRARHTVGRLLELGLDVNRADASNETSLHAVARNGWSELVDRLVAAGAVVNARSADGVTPIMEAVQEDHSSTVEALLAHGANANVADRHGATPLMLVSTPEVAKLLIGAGANPNAGDHTRATALIYAAGRGLPEVVRALLDAGADPDASTDLGDTALHRAAVLFDTTAQQRCITALLDAGADINEETAEGFTPLMVAARAGLPDALRFLLAKGANVDAQTAIGHTAVTFVCDRAGQPSRDFTQLQRMEKSARVLAAGNANLDALARDGGTALHQTVCLFDSRLAKTLLEFGANPNLQTRQGVTPLMVAAAAKRSDMVSALIAAGADVNARDSDGTTALVYAIRGEADEEQAAVVEALLQHGANPGLRNTAGESAATLAGRMQLPREIKAKIAAAARALKER